MCCLDVEMIANVAVLAIDDALYGHTALIYIVYRSCFTFVQH